MILKHAKALNGIKVVLASASPRRKEILGNIGLTVQVCCRVAMCILTQGNQIYNG